MKHARSESGFSVLELLVAVSILAFAIGVPFVLLRSSQRLQTSTTARAELRLQARRALDRIADRLAGSSASMIAQYIPPPVGLAPGVGVPAIDYQVASDWTAGAVLWQDAERLALDASPSDPDNGLDDDGDGLVDERRLAWTIDVGLATERTHVLCADVPENLEGELPANGADDNGNGLVDEPGFVIAFGVDEAVVRLSLAGRDSQGVRIEQTTERTVAFRN